MKKTILFIDDDLIRTNPYKRHLELSGGYKIIMSTTPKQALDELEANKEEINLIILDIMMPHGDELEVTNTDHGRRTGLVLLDKLMDIKPDIPVIVLTVVRNNEVRTLLENKGIKKFLNKPIALDVFLAEVKDVFVSLEEKGAE